LLHDVNHEYAAPIISQQGEVCGRLKVEVSRISGTGLFVYLFITDIRVAIQVVLSGFLV